MNTSSLFCFPLCFCFLAATVAAQETDPAAKQQTDLGMPVEAAQKVEVAPKTEPVAGASESPEQPEELPTIAVKTEGFQRLDRGLFTLYQEREAGRVWLALPKPSGGASECARFLYVEGLRTGLGSNPVGLDRGQIGPTRLIAARELGGRVLFEELNLAYRTESENAAERRAGAESFATSVHWAGAIAARDPDGTVLVDWTSFIVRDAHGTAASLARTKQGTFELDPERSVLLIDETLALPDNLELEALLTFAGEQPGALVRETAPTATAVTLVQHHSLVRLPPGGYRTRRADATQGHLTTNFVDLAAPIDEPLERAWAVRHRLEKIDPQAERSAVVEPIVYYLDPGCPEPVRSALRDGALWWAEAFEQAGFLDAFRVEDLPVGIHPLDVRYNVIQWVHRSTRGWSYGGGVSDPRTGEMLKGHVTLGALRVRQDRLIFEGLLGAEATGNGTDRDPVQLALARLRQLAAHEVGHTLGLAHNFAASAQGRASVMDYPAPWVELSAGDSGRLGLDPTQAYDVGVGAWDVHAIRWLYSEFSSVADEANELARIAQKAQAAGLYFLTDSDARPPGAADPRANLWDNGADPVAELERVMDVRRFALERFGRRNVAAEQPLSRLRATLVPLYLHHRYQLVAAAKVLGGVEYQHQAAGAERAALELISSERQRTALEALLGALSPAELDLSDELRALLVPALAATGVRDDEWLTSSTDPIFDALGAVRTATELVLDGLLQRERLARLVEQHQVDPDNPSPLEVCERLVDAVFPFNSNEDARLAEARRTIQAATAARLAQLVVDKRAVRQARVAAEDVLGRLVERLARDVETGPLERAHRRSLARELRTLLERPWELGYQPEERTTVPPGSPIGCAFGPH